MGGAGRERQYKINTVIKPVSNADIILTMTTIKTTYIDFNASYKPKRTYIYRQIFEVEF